MPTNPQMLDRLTDLELASVRALVQTNDAKAAAKLLGLFSVTTLWKVAAGAAVHRFTVQTVRERLAAEGIV